MWRVLGVREVLAPLNAARGGYPGEPERSFGPSGLALAGDRWDVRQAVVIQGALRERGRAYDWLTLYVDVQTQQPLYAITERRGEGRLVEVGILVHRFSGDQPGYPGWPDGESASRLRSGRRAVLRRARGRRLAPRVVRRAFARRSARATCGA